MLAAAAAAASLWLWPRHVEATGAAGSLELTLMRAVLDRAVAREAPHLTNPLTPSEETLRRGLKLFHDNCSGCHGDGTHRSRRGTTSFLPRVPQFGREPPGRPDWQIRWILTRGIRNTAMGAWADLVSEEEIWQVSSFVSRLRSLPGSVAAEWAGPAPDGA